MTRVHSVGTDFLLYAEAYKDPCQRSADVVDVAHFAPISVFFAPSVPFVCPLIMELSSLAVAAHNGSRCQMVALGRRGKYTLLTTRD